MTVKTVKTVIDPLWKQRLARDIKRFRKDLSMIDVWQGGEWHMDKEGKKEKVLINRWYKIRSKGFKTVMLELKQCLTVKSNRVRRYSIWQT